MATKFYNVEKAAQVLGISPAEVNAMRERQELHGYRDGADWKFKADEVDALVAQRPGQAADEDVLLSEVELGGSDPGSSGTVIGPPPEEAIHPGKGSDIGSSLSGFEDLDLSLEDSQLDLAVDSSTGSSSGLELAGDELDDDDLVLGGGSGSDITIGGDSGISLVDPADSGLSLEEPLDLVGGSHESLELGEDDMVSLGKEPPAEAPTELATEGDFLLTPLEESPGEEESGSQVIALDAAEESVPEGLPAMLEAELGEEELVAAAPAPLGAVAPAGRAARAPAVAARDFGVSAQAAAGPVAVALPEAPYSAWNILSLSLCAVVLVLVGMFMLDLMWNMWSWNSAYPMNSWLMDLILGR